MINQVQVSSHVATGYNPDTVTFWQCPYMDWTRDVTETAVHQEGNPPSGQSFLDWVMDHSSASPSKLLSKKVSYMERQHGFYNCKSVLVKRCMGLRALNTLTESVFVCQLIWLSLGAIDFGCDKVFCNQGVCMSTIYQYSMQFQFHNTWKVQSRSHFNLSL